jgi:hypothetical protein
MSAKKIVITRTPNQNSQKLILNQASKHLLDPVKSSFDNTLRQSEKVT